MYNLMKLPKINKIPDFKGNTILPKSEVMNAIESNIYGYGTAPNGEFIDISNPSLPEINVVITDPSNVKDSTETKILHALLRIEDYLKCINRKLEDIQYHVKNR